MHASRYEQNEFWSMQEVGGIYVAGPEYQLIIEAAERVLGRLDWAFRATGLMGLRSGYQRDAVAWFGRFNDVGEDALDALPLCDSIEMIGTETGQGLGVDPQTIFDRSDGPPRGAAFAVRVNDAETWKIYAHGCEALDAVIALWRHLLAKAYGYLD